MRQPTRYRIATVIGTLLALAQSSPPASAQTEPPRVSIGDVSVAATARGDDANAELGPALRSLLRDELTRVAGLPLLKRPVVLSASLTQLSSERHEERAAVSAVISLALRRADDQVLFAELRGRASVEDAAGDLASLRRAALRGAVRGALTRLPEAVRRSR